VGDVLSFYAEIIHVGRSSMTVDVAVYSQPLHDAGQVLKVTEAVLTYVAVDDQGRPRPLPPG
jgi:acyl-CoA thioesterase YciA